MNERVEEALRAVAARRAKYTPEQKREYEMMTVLMLHVVMCCPREQALDYPGRFRWIRDELPPIGGEGCDCKGKGMRVLGPEYFLAKIEQERAA